MAKPRKKDIQSQVTEVLKEIIIEKIVEVPRHELSDFDLYKALKDAGMPQGGIGQSMEDPNGTEKVYLPHASEIYSQFAQDPRGWEIIRDYLARAYLELQKR